MNHNRRLLSLACAALAATAAGSALADDGRGDYGTVVSASPAYAQVAVPQRQCVEQEQVYRQPQTGAGALIGALVGGGLGNAVGGGAGRAAATGIGAVAGALIGDRAEASNAPENVATVQQCHTVNRYESRVVGYDVVYDYRGQRYSARLPHDPGPRIALNVDVRPQSALAPVQESSAPPVYSAPQVVYSEAPVVYGQPVYYGPPVYAPPAYVGPSIGLSIRSGWGWGGGGYRHWH